MALKIMDKNCCDIYEKFEKKNLLLKSYYYWDVIVRNKQVTLGSCVIILKRHVENFGQVEPDELTEFSDAVQELEKALKNIFSYDKINYLMLMMVDNHVHFHVIPRYQKEKEFDKNKFQDKCWPKISDMQPQEISKETIIKIKEKILSNY
ncbi:HIT family protein [Candidatus Woesearchaeota archaeon]|nr:HIT family protein [Candidatus Woesearchaeota archaeon]